MHQLIHIACLVVSMLVWSPWGGATGNLDGDLAIVGVTIIPMTADGPRAVANQTVVVSGDRIVALGTAGGVEIPVDAHVIDGTGHYLIPGLAEMHGHIPSPAESEEIIHNTLFLYLAGGVTTVRGMLGHPGQLELKRKVARGDVVGPTLYLAGPSFNGRSVRSAEDAEAKVRQQYADGWDLLKVHPGVPRAAYDRMADTARELGIRFGGHVPEDVGLMHALESGQETFDHIDGFIEYLGAADGAVTDAQLREVAGKTREHGAHIVPTMALWETLWGVLDPAHLAAYDELKYMPQGDVRSWERGYNERRDRANKDVSSRVIETRLRLLKVMQEEGVSILFGTDAPQVYSVPGFSVHRETERMVAAGLTPYEILTSATRSVGLYFSNEDDFGTIEVGKRADLVLLEANPIEDIANLRRNAGVVVRGKWLPAGAIAENLDRIAAGYR